jgi:hypothetical protein
MNYRRETKIADEMINKGYLMVIVFNPQDDLDPLYVKDLAQACMVIKEDFPSAKNYKIITTAQFIFELNKLTNQ